VTALGCNSSVGVSGLTLGGGLGWFVGTHGASCDVLEGARVVTVDGKILSVGPNENEDLYWAIRGGGGNFGIVSELTYKTFVQEEIISGVLIYPGSLVKEVLRFYREEMSRTSNELTVELLGVNYSQPLILCSFCYSGDLTKADKIFSPWKEAIKPLADGLSKRSFSQLEDIPEHILPYITWPGEPDQSTVRKFGSYWQGTCLEKLTDRAIDEIAKIVESPPFGAGWGLGHVQRGACIENARFDTPFIRRQGSTAVQFNGAWEIEKREKPIMGWVDDSIKALEPLSGKGGYINYLSSNDLAKVKKTYGQHFERLMKLKQKYDPENMLRRNRNIRSG
jgi:hypothetical protein